MPADPLHDSHDWLDRDAGPVVRPYAMIQGRVAPAGGELDLVAFVVATMPELPPPPQTKGFVEAAAAAAAPAAPASPEPKPVAAPEGGKAA